MTMLLDTDDVATAATHIIVADDHPLVRGALRRTLSAALADVSIREAGDLAALGRELRCGEPVDLVLLDLAMPGVGGLAGLLYLRSQNPSVRVVVTSATEDRTLMRRCIEIGAAGFIPGDTAVEVMREAIGAVLSGETWTATDLEGGEPADPGIADMMRRLASLTPQQLRVLMMLSQGLLNKQIAYALGVSEATIKAHVSAILQKLGVEGRTQAVTAVATIDRGRFTPEAARSSRA